MKKIDINRIFTIKFIVGFSLVVSLLGMSAILGVGYAQIKKENSSKSEDISVVDRLLETTVNVVGGEGGTPTITLKTTPNTIATGESATIDWSAESADVCAASGAWSGVKNAVGNQSTGLLQETKKFTLTCTNAQGPTSIDTTVTVDPSLVPASNITTDTPSSSGSPTDSTNSSPPASTTPSPNSTPTTPPPTGGSTGVAPVLTLTISNGTITAGATASISWTINGTASPTPSCTASGSWSGSKATSGSQNVSPGAGSYTYTLNCTNSSGSSSKSVNLTVNAASSCGTGGSCSSAVVASHNTQSNCWVIIKYTSGGGNGANGQVYKLSSSLFGGSGSHSGLPSAPSLSATSWCGKNISSTFNGKHSGGSRSDGTNSAIWWLTNNGNSLIGPYSGA